MELKDLYIGKIVLYEEKNLPVVIRDLTFNSCGEVIAVVSFPTIENLAEEVIDPFIATYLNSEAQCLYEDPSNDFSRVIVHPSNLKEL